MTTHGYVHHAIDFRDPQGHELAVWTAAGDA